MITVCDHRIRNYQLKIDGEARGEYTARFPCEPVQSLSSIYIRSWEDEQKYLRSLKNYSQAQSYAFFNGVGSKSWDAPIQGANAVIGIGGWAFIEPTVIKFDTLPGEYRTVYPDKNLVPRNKYLVDFTANPKTCPRCLGTNTVVDLSIDDTGNFTFLSGAEKMKQRIIKALTQPVGTCLSDIYFGSELNNLVGRVITDDIRIVIQTTIVSAINHLIDVQPATYTPEETITAISGITIEAAPNAVDAFYVKVIVTNAAGQEIDCSVAFKLG